MATQHFIQWFWRVVAPVAGFGAIIISYVTNRYEPYTLAATALLILWASECPDLYRDETN